jgi:DNA-binding response OmpR family regulator
MLHSVLMESRTVKAVTKASDFRIGAIRMSSGVQGKRLGNVLVVEDDEDTGGVIQEMVARAGYGITVVTNRDDAVIALTKYLYDIVIMDYNMPGLAAEDFLARVKRRHARTRVILMTAAGKAPLLAQELELDRWIGKPFTPDELLGVLRDMSEDKAANGK